MPPVITSDEGQRKNHLDQRVRQAVAQTRNALREAEADQRCGAPRDARSPDRLDTRAGPYGRTLPTKAGEVELQVPRLRALPCATQSSERSRRRASSVEEALSARYRAGVSVRRVEDITEALGGTKVSARTVSALNQQRYAPSEAWCNRAIAGEHPCVYRDGLGWKRSGGGEVRNVAVRVASGVQRDGHREIGGVREGSKEDAAGWRTFRRHRKARGLQGVRRVVSDQCGGLVEAVGACFPAAQGQRCMVHCYRQVCTAVPPGKGKEGAAMRQAIHAPEDRAAAAAKVQAVAAQREGRQRAQAAAVLRSGVAETWSYRAFPREHGTRRRTDHVRERLRREVRRRTRVVGNLPDGESAVMWVAARLRHVAGTRWGSRRYLDMERLREQEHTREPAA